MTTVLDFLSLIPELQEWFTDTYPYVRNPFGMHCALDERPATPVATTRKVLVRNTPLSPWRTRSRAVNVVCLSPHPCLPLFAQMLIGGKEVEQEVESLVVKNREQMELKAVRGFPGSDPLVSPVSFCFDLR
jgi:hypothetical protein